MNTHNILLIVQYITVSALFAEILIVFSRWKDSVHTYLFLSCIATFISNIGYLFELKAGTEEAYLTALKLSYVGRTWIVFAFFLFSAKICRVKIRKSITVALVTVLTGIYVSVLTVGKHTLYYTDYHFDPDPEYPKFYHSNGTIHDILMGLNAVLIVIAISWVINAYRKEKHKKSKLKYKMLILAFSVQSIAYVLQIFKVFAISEYYDLSMPGALGGTAFMFVAIFKYDLLGTSEIARDFVIDRISEGIIAVDNDGRIQYYNEPAAKLYPEFDYFFAKKNDPIKALTDKGDGKKYLTPYDIISDISEAVEKDNVIKIEDRIYTPEENDLMYGGENYGKLYALVDDTEHYEYMEELQKQRDIADNANEAKSRFLANMSHEIRTPINAVLGMDEMILRESNEKTIRDYASDIMSAGRTLLSLINDILDLSKVEEGKMEIIPVQYDLSYLINDLINMIRDRATKKGLELKVNVDEKTPHLLFGDEIRIRQCAMNLLTNSVKYTEKGEVLLSVSYEKKDDDNILLTINVKDTGIGMKEEDMENLFSPYKRIEEERNRTIEGTGLGMSITRHLLELMGSGLKVKSVYGEGTEISFTVEQKVVKWEEIGDYSKRFNNRSNGTYDYHELFHAPDAKILVIDDTEMNLTVIKSLLKKTGVKIDTAMSGKEGLSLSEKESYDVVFIDHMMPDMDGVETLSHMRESGKNTDTPAVALTANAVSGAREMYLDAGFNDYLSKPVDGMRLEKLLFNLIPDDKLKEPESDGNVVPEADPEPDKDNTTLPDWISELPGVNVSDGIMNCGSEEGYLSVLCVFHQTAECKADEIENAYKNKDIENYTIKVHALKSSARIIGVKKLSELARSLEEAGKAKDLEFIGNNTDRLLSMYRAFDNELKRFDCDKKNLPAIDEKTLKEAYQTIAEISGSMDYEMMECVLKELDGYSLPEEDEKRLVRMERMLSELDWEGILKEASEGR